MDKYIIYCTPEQTIKALELAAPILGLSSTTKDDITTIQCVKLDTPIHTDIIEGGFDYAIIPTAEQMIGWLEAREDINEIELVKSLRGWVFVVYTRGGILDVKDSKVIFSTRKEATIASIDAALEYLTKNKK